MLQWSLLTVLQTKVNLVPTLFLVWSIALLARSCDYLGSLTATWRIPCNTKVLPAPMMNIINWWVTHSDAQSLSRIYDCVCWCTNIQRSSSLGCWNLPRIKNQQERGPRATVVTRWFLHLVSTEFEDSVETIIKAIELLDMYQVKMYLSVWLCILWILRCRT